MKLSEDRYKDFFGIPPPIGRKSQDSREESIILESANVVHGENCDKIGCKCTPIKDCNKHDEERWQQHRDSHKGRYVGVRAKRAKKQEHQQEADNWDPTIELDPETEKREKEEFA